MRGLMEVLERVGQWIGVNDARLKKVFFVADREGLTIYVVARSASYDSELTRSLSALTIEFADNGIDMVGSQIPDGTPEELAAFFDPRQALLLTRG